ncbi:MAG: ureidoglycolate lyase [Eubacteriales bacterium]|nr:ureidoglycolate lyase [Eubacteriales bacterium]
MRTIKAQPLTAEAFQPYGTFTDLLHPTGYNLDGFYQDRVKMSVAGNMNLAFSPLVVKKADPMIVTAAEYHDSTQEGIVCLDDDIIIHVAPASKVPVPELTEAFFVPRGTLVCLHLGTWHLAPIAVHEETAHVLITLPERIYKNDCVVIDYAEEQQIKIEL